MSYYLTDKEYKNIYDKVPRICIDILIRNKDGILLTKREIPPYKNTWHLPGGGIRFRESIENAINRISKDELGIRVKIIKFVGSIEFLNESVNLCKRHSISIVYLCVPIEDVLITKKQKYFSVLARNIHPIHKSFLIKNKLL